MKASVEQAAFARALGTVARIISPKAAAVLSNVWISTEKEALQLVTANGELSVTVRVPAQVDSPGRLATPAQTLQTLVTSLAPGAVTLEVQEGRWQVALRGGRFAAELKGMDPDQYPTHPSAPPVTLHLPVAGVRQALHRVLGVCAKVSPKPVYTGVLVELEGEKAQFTASDGYRLASQGLKALKAPAAPARVVIAPAPMRELERALNQDKDEDLPVELGLGAEGRLVSLRYRDTLLVGRTLEGRYPEWRNILPRAYQGEITLDRAELLQAVRRARLFLPEGAKVAEVTLEALPAQETLQVRVEASAAGSFKDSLAAAGTGQGMVLRFSHLYLEAVLAMLDAEKVTLKLAGPELPVLFQPQDGTDYLHVVVPLTPKPR